MERMKIAVVGSANMDLVFRCEKLPAPGETLPGSSFATFPGGKGANQAVAVAKLGGEPLFVGKIGRDAFGHQLLQSMELSGVDCSKVGRSDTSTGVAGITVDRSGQNSIVVVPGANADLSASEVNEGMSGFSGVVLAQLEVPVDVVVTAFKRSDIISILNPAPAILVDDALLAMLDYITPNESETRVMTSISPSDSGEASKAASWFHDRGVSNVIITLGAGGSFWSSGTQSHHYPSISVSPVDTTAAGDAFNGALAFFLAEGRELPNSIALANRVGALSTTRAGAQTSMPTMEELRAIAGELL